MRHALALVLLAGCGVNLDYPVDSPDGVERATQAAFMPVWLGFFGSFYLWGDESSCPAVHDLGDGRYRVEGDGCAADDGGNYHGTVEVTGLEGDDDLSGSEFHWREFTFEDPEGSVTIDGTQRWGDASEYGELRTDLRIESTSAQAGLVGDWQYRDHVVIMPSQELSGAGDESYDIEGVVITPDNGAFRIEGSGENTDACAGEPARGALTIRGSGSATLTFDGETDCDGTSPVSGDVEGVVDWDGAPPLACNTGAVSVGWLALLLAPLVRRRRR